MDFFQVINNEARAALEKEKCSREAELTDEKLSPRECGDWASNEIVSLNPWGDYSISSMRKPENHLQNIIIKLDPCVTPQPTLIVDRLKNLMTKIHILLDFW